MPATTPTHITAVQFIASVAVYAAPLVVLVVIFAVAGYLSPRALDRVPNRRIGLCPCNRVVALRLLIAIIIAIAAVFIVRGVFAAIFGPHVKMSDLPIDKRMILQLILQLASEAPIAGFLFYQASRRRGGLKRIGLIPRRPVHDLLVGAAGAVAALILVFSVIAVTTLFSIYFLHQKPPELGHKLLREMVRHRAALPIALSFLMAVVIAPILEESIFRGLIQSSLVEMFGPTRRWRAIFITSALFMAAHLGSGVSWQSLPGLFVLALVLGWTYERTGDLWSNITIHAVFNTYNLLIALLIIR